jgi:hypothetical protein
MLSYIGVGLSTSSPTSTSLLSSLMSPTTTSLAPPSPSPSPSSLSSSSSKSPPLPSTSHVASSILSPGRPLIKVDDITRNENIDDQNNKDITPLSLSSATSTSIDPTPTAPMLPTIDHDSHMNNEILLLRAALRDATSLLLQWQQTGFFSSITTTAALPPFCFLLHCLCLHQSHRHCSIIDRSHFIVDNTSLRRSHTMRTINS